MAENDLPASVAQFLESCIDSIEQLEVLLLLHSQPNREWTVDQITQELRSSSDSIRKRLVDIYATGILTTTPSDEDRHRFIPASADVARVIDLLSDQNRIRRYKIIDRIYSKSVNRIQVFADAFKLKGDKK